jgi:phosphoglycolate phosphatase
MLGKFKLQETFDGVQGMMNTLALGKLEGGMLLLDSYGIERRRTVFIGDTTHDAEVARTLGVSCVLLSTGHQSRARNREIAKSGTLLTNWTK